MQSLSLEALLIYVIFAAVPADWRTGLAGHNVERLEMSNFSAMQILLLWCNSGDQWLCGVKRSRSVPPCIKREELFIYCEGACPLIGQSVLIQHPPFCSCDLANELNQSLVVPFDEDNSFIAGNAPRLHAMVKSAYSFDVLPHHAAMHLTQVRGAVS